MFSISKMLNMSVVLYS